MHGLYLEDKVLLTVGLLARLVHPFILAKLRIENSLL